MLSLFNFAAFYSKQKSPRVTLSSESMLTSPTACSSTSETTSSWQYFRDYSGPAQSAHTVPDSGIQNGGAGNIDLDLAFNRLEAIIFVGCVDRKRRAGVRIILLAAVGLCNRFQRAFLQAFQDAALIGMAAKIADSI